MFMDERARNDVHKCLLFILQDINRICRKYDIKYTLGYGTESGDVRHKGFIPWDDDADLCMTRKEYNKFCKVVKDELNELLEFSAPKKKFYGDLPKVFLKNAFMACESLDCSNWFIYENIRVDIMIVDVFSKVDYYRFRFLDTVCSWGERKTAVISSFFGYLSIPLVVFTAKILPLQKLERKTQRFVDEILRKSCKTLEEFPESTGRVSARNSVWAERTRLPASFFEDVELVDFENIKLAISKHYHPILTQIYGDYMTPPPDRQNVNLAVWEERQNSRLGHGSVFVKITPSIQKKMDEFWDLVHQKE